MGKIYINQPFKIKSTIVEDIDGVETVVNVTGLPVKFFYLDPDAIEASFTAVVTDGPNGLVEYDVPQNILTKEGPYTFWTVVTFGNGDVPAEPIKLTLFERGK